MFNQCIYQVNTNVKGIRSFIKKQINESEVTKKKKKSIVFIPNDVEVLCMNSDDPYLVPILTLKK